MLHAKQQQGRHFTLPLRGGSTRGYLRKCFENTYSSIKRNFSLKRWGGTFLAGLQTTSLPEVLDSNVIYIVDCSVFFSLWRWRYSMVCCFDVCVDLLTDLRLDYLYNNIIFVKVRPSPCIVWIIQH